MTNPYGPMPRAALAPGDVFAGEFVVVKPLAAGGMGAVYVVEQKTTGRRRALKLMRPELVMDARVRGRFHQEARVGARVQSEHVVEVVDAGVEEETGTPWIAMELLEGEDLADYAKTRQPIPWRTTREIVAQLCHALGAAHRAGIVHRDLKPENVFIAKSRRSDVELTVKVLDFGIAKWLDDARTSGSGTQSVGTPLWMAPEQAEPGARIDASTDVWALGLLVFWMLTGRYYWRTLSAPDASVRQLVVEMMAMPLDPPSQRASVVGASAPLPHGFDAWFARCVVREPEARYPNATAAFAALAPLLEVDPMGATTASGIAARAPERPSAARPADEPIQLPTSRAPLYAGAAVAVALAIAGLGALAFASGAGAPDTQRRAEEPASDASVVAPLASAAVEGAQGEPEHADPAPPEPAAVHVAPAAEGPRRRETSRAHVEPAGEPATRPAPPEPAPPEPASPEPHATSATRALVIANERASSLRVALRCGSAPAIETSVEARGQAEVQIPSGETCATSCSDAAGIVMCPRVSPTAARLRVR